MEPKIDGILLQEAYFGKQKELIQIENLFNILRKDLTPKQQFDLSKVKSIVKSREMEKIERLFASLFGFNEVFIEIIDMGGEYNLYATPKLPALYMEKIFNKGEIVSTKEVYNSIKMTNKGYFIDKRTFPLDIYVAISIPTFFHKELTDEELVAGILHEIGHHLYGIISKSKVENIAKTVGSSIFNKPGISINDEQFSDKVAAMYGYGSALSSFLNRAGIKALTNNNNITLNQHVKDTYEKSDGLAQVFMTLTQVYLGIVLVIQVFVIQDLYAFRELLRAWHIPLIDKILVILGVNGDPHPATPYRVLNNIHYMQKELERAKTNNPRLAKNIQEEIKKSKKILEDSIKGEYSFNSDENALISHKIASYAFVLHAISPIQTISNIFFRIVSWLFTADKGDKELETKSRNKGYFNLY